jgi:SAM-dependent methyltransferase
MIDVKHLIEGLPDDELLRAADRYFSSMTLASEQCWKPFSNPLDAVHLTRHLHWVLAGANLFRGVRVMDFGCGTGWLTHALAQMGCHAVGVDIAPSALELARAVGQPGPAGRPAGYGSAAFVPYDGHRLPVETGSLDRIVCFDAFHHVRDQGATLAEFARALKDGGRAAFVEPGPHHSKAPLSQAEMASHHVIENDVDMAAVSRLAQAAGFDKPRMLIQYPAPVELTVDDYLSWSQGSPPAGLGHRLLAPLQQHLTNAQCFYLQKGTHVRNSLQREGLAAGLELVSLTCTDGLMRFRVAVRNSGNRRWLCAPGAGQVNLGLQLVGPSGRMLDNDYGRVRLPSGDVEPGQTVELTGVCAMPDQRDCVVQLDMVSELVCWFADVGDTQPLKLSQLPGSE